jgi:hypothetical protein
MRIGGPQQLQDARRHGSAPSAVLRPRDPRDPAALIERSDARRDATDKVGGNRGCHEPQPVMRELMLASTFGACRRFARGAMMRVALQPRIIERPAHTGAITQLLSGGTPKVAVWFGTRASVARQSRPPTPARAARPSCLNG